MTVPIVRYQVFLSSTFADLKEERAQILEALLGLDCFPVGMEHFVASESPSWEAIKPMIDQTDYMVLLVAGRYGSVNEEGVSFTELEYDYAKSVGVPVLPFIHGAIGSLPSDHVDRGRARGRLDTFRSRIEQDHLIKRWTTSGDLTTKVVTALAKARQETPRPGWTRSSPSPNMNAETPDSPMGDFTVNEAHFVPARGRLAGNATASAPVSAFDGRALAHERLAILMSRDPIPEVVRRQAHLHLVASPTGTVADALLPFLGNTEHLQLMADAQASPILRAVFPSDPFSPPISYASQRWPRDDGFPRRGTTAATWRTLSTSN